MKTLQEIGEHAAIAALTANLKAVGDDCAVLPMSEKHDMVLTSDPLIHNVHFTAEATPEQIANKAAGRVLSDFAAMGAEPQYLLINVVAPPEQKFQTLEKIYAEFSNLWKKYGVEIVGGDLAQGPVLELHVFGVGRVPKATALLRSGAKPGDLIYVTGPLGGAQTSGKHLTFEPRLEWGKQLRESGVVTSMMDISDGLATDLRHILKASGVGAELDSKKVPTFAKATAGRPKVACPACPEQSRREGARRAGQTRLNVQRNRSPYQKQFAQPHSPQANGYKTCSRRPVGDFFAGSLDAFALTRRGALEEALYDGEDFELLFTAPPDVVFQGLEKKFPTLGKVTANSGELLLDGVPLDGKAYEHFKS